MQQNKRAKLDPTSREDADDYSNSHASAKDVMDNKSKTAKKVTLPSKDKLPKPIVDDDSDEVEIPDMDVDDDDEEDSMNSNDQEEEEADENEQEEEKDEASDSLIQNSTQLVFDDDGNELSADGSGKVEKTNDKPNKKTNKKELSPEEQKKKKENLAKLREKLSAKISVLKEKRKAPGSKTGVAKSRDQILEERKRKDELRRQEKLKRKLAALDEDEDDDEASDSDSDDDADAKQDKSVLYGNITFNDGSRVTSDLSNIRSTAEKKKLKGPANNDIKAHLLKLEQKKHKLSHLTPEEQEKQKEKDQWQRVISQAEGVKVKDDEKLLKKALKRKEKQKLKSEIEWKERKQIVKDTVSARLKRREENLKARKDNKGKKGKQQPKLRKFTGTINNFANSKKKRAGFEGNAKSGKGKK